MNKAFKGRWKLHVGDALRDTTPRRCPNKDIALTTVWRSTIMTQDRNTTYHMQWRYVTTCSAALLSSDVCDYVKVGSNASQTQRPNSDYRYMEYRDQRLSSNTNGTYHTLSYDPRK